jgi:hypothetical protein
VPAAAGDFLLLPNDPGFAPRSDGSTCVNGCIAATCQRSISAGSEVPRTSSPERSDGSNPTAALAPALPPIDILTSRHTLP